MSGYQEDGSNPIKIDDFRSNFNSSTSAHVSDAFTVFTTFRAELTFRLILFIIMFKAANICAGSYGPSCIA